MYFTLVITYQTADGGLFHKQHLAEKVASCIFICLFTFVKFVLLYIITILNVITCIGTCLRLSHFPFFALHGHCPRNYHNCVHSDFVVKYLRNCSL
jgi:hypothetical protein